MAQNLVCLETQKDTEGLSYQNEYYCAAILTLLIKVNDNCAEFIFTIH